MITIFWIAPQLGKIIMLRSTTDCLIADVFQYVRDKMITKAGLIMVAPILTFKGTQELPNPRISKYKTGDTFLIFDEEVPEECQEHSG